MSHRGVSQHEIANLEPYFSAVRHGPAGDYVDATRARDILSGLDPDHPLAPPMVIDAAAAEAARLRWDASIGARRSFAYAHPTDITSLACGESHAAIIGAGKLGFFGGLMSAWHARSTPDPNTYCVRKTHGTGGR